VRRKFSVFFSSLFLICKNYSYKLKKCGKLLKAEISSFKTLFLNLNFIHYWRRYCIYNFELKKRNCFLGNPIVDTILFVAYQSSECTAKVENSRDLRSSKRDSQENSWATIYEKKPLLKTLIENRYTSY